LLDLKVFLKRAFFSNSAQSQLPQYFCLGHFGDDRTGKLYFQLEDMEKMQRVLDASISVIGEERSLYDLALNFLYLGKTSQARKLLETPGLR
jgi:hypothetical protein